MRILFQDEARFGRMSDPRGCWAPMPYRPVVALALIREYRYKYAAVSPQDGELYYMTADKMNTQSMNCFIQQLSLAHSETFNIIVLDGASSHTSKDIISLPNIYLIQLPPYSPELNPVEQIWNTLRRDYIANRLFDSLDEVTMQAEKGLADMASNPEALRSLTNWPWINNAILNA